jgi:Ca2+-binding EF-hand superfamily protein
MMNNAWKMNSGSKQYGRGVKVGSGRHSSPLRPGPKADMKFTPGAFQTSAESYGNAGKVDDFVSEEELKTAVGKFRAKLIQRGARGFIGLQRQFKIMDDNNSKTLDKDEFKKAVKDFRVGVSDEDIKTIWNHFDIDQSGEISYDEFVRGVRGPMNKGRQALVKKAFQILDRDGSGTVDSSDIKGVYNGSRHPDVLSGKKTEDEILGDFLETFESHHNLHAGRKNDQSVSFEEFLEYYNNVSASVDNDEYFELMMNNAWNLDKKRVTKKGWGGEA